MGLMSLLAPATGVVFLYANSCCQIKASPAKVDGSVGDCIIDTRWTRFYLLTGVLEPVTADTVETV